MSSAKTRAAATLEEHVEQDAFLLLEGAGEGDPGVEVVEHRLDDLLRREGFGVGRADELRDASLHARNGTTHQGLLSAALQKLVVRRKRPVWSGRPST